MFSAHSFQTFTGLGGDVWFLGLGANAWRAREREPITVVWGWGSGAKLPEAESLFKTVSKSMLKFFNVK